MLRKPPKKRKDHGNNVINNAINTQNLNIFSFRSNDTQFSQMSMDLNQVPDTEMDIDDINFPTLSPVLDPQENHRMKYGESNDVTLSQSFLELNLAESQQQNATNEEIYNFERALADDLNQNHDANGGNGARNGNECHYGKVKCSQW